MEKIIANCLGILFIGIFLSLCYWFCFWVQKCVKKHYGNDFFSKNKDIIKKSAIALMVILCILGFVIGFIF